MAGGTNQYSSMPQMRRAQRFAGQDQFGKAQEAWEAGGGEWTPETRQAMEQLGGVGAGRLGQALRFGQGGMFGRAAQQIGRGGGQWGEGYNDQEDGVGGLLRGYLGANPGADVGAFDYGDISESDLAQAQRFGRVGMMGRAKGMFGDAWTGAQGRRMRNQLAADAARNPYEKGTSMGFDWGGTSGEQVAAAKEQALLGKFGRAKQAFGEGWNPLMSQQMRAYQKGNV